MLSNLKNWLNKKKVERKLAKDQKYYQKYITDENKGGGKVHTSPCGNYAVRTTAYQTKEGSWGITHAEVVRISTCVEGAGIITSFIRNYPSFPFLWIKHPTNNMTYLVCGRDYQGYDIINCYTGRVMTHLPISALKGFGFCHAQYCGFDAEALTIKVYGCYWAAPYEMRVYDFSDPEVKFPLRVIDERELTPDERIKYELDDECKECSVWTDRKAEGFGVCDDRCDDPEEIAEIYRKVEERMKNDVIERIGNGWRPCQKAGTELGSNVNMWYLKRGQKFKFRNSDRGGKQESMCMGESKYIRTSGVFNYIERNGVVFWEGV